MTDERKWLLAATSFEATNSVFNITDENHSCSISTTGFWTSRGSGPTIIKLREVLERKTQNDIEIHVAVKKKGNQMKILDKEYKLSDLDTRKK